MQQKRAEHALKIIRKAREDFARDKEKSETFVSCAANLPASILINGLGQAAATLLVQAKNDENDPRKAIYHALEDWLCHKDPVSPYFNGSTLLAAITEGDRDSYRHAQAEALAYLEWFKKLAVAFLKRV
jgi:CRISPR-associated protein Cmr5